MENNKKTGRPCKIWRDEVDGESKINGMKQGHVAARNRRQWRKIALEVSLQRTVALEEEREGEMENRKKKKKKRGLQKVLKISFCAADVVPNRREVTIPAENRVSCSPSVEFCCLPVNAPYFQTICFSIQSSHENQLQLGLPFIPHASKVGEHGSVTLTTSAIILLAIKQSG
jgi:hypothetical protein